MIQSIFFEIILKSHNLKRQKLNLKMLKAKKHSPVGAMLFVEHSK